MRSCWLWLAFLCCVGATGAHPEAAPCDSPEARQFDFWLGDWQVHQRIRQSDGAWLSLPARTSVTREVEGCALLERWSGEVQFPWEGMGRPEPEWGLSIRSYDAKEGVWRIFWMDTRHPEFGDPFVGRFRGDRGEFLRDAGEKSRTRIVFTREADGSVLWELAVANAANGWDTLWTMEMRREEPVH